MRRHDGRPVRLRRILWAVAALALLATLVVTSSDASAAQPTETGLQESPRALAVMWQQDVYPAMVRMPIAALLGAALALRPKRRGTPKRTPAVVQTQIILAIVGAVIMLVVGASLARAFGIVGAANLIRYRSKIDDPKDAGVMLCCLAVGLASGVGLIALAVFSTAFLVATVALIESFEPTRSEQFELKVTVSQDAADLRPRLEQILERFRMKYSLRTASSEELAYDVTVPFEVETDRVTNAVLKLGPEEEVAVSWDQKNAKKA
jgi:uncharacterized membrane protein YhiD involved in acid resistance